MSTMSIFTKILAVGVARLHTDRRTVMKLVGDEKRAQK